MENCNKCKSEKIAKHGVRKNKHSKNQVYYCKNCRKFFTNNESSSKIFKNKTYQKEVIIAALEFFCKGFSYDKIVRKLGEKYEYKISKSTVHRWVGKIKKEETLKNG
jgi:transposase-like protein